ncbi:MAG: hypothetical protein QMD36_03860 [Candidatus Aenigmarchaeota archaeon]|nr:hypothetical protein [Candidatus Aenigmarchaeota archaeon]
MNKRIFVLFLLIISIIIFLLYHSITTTAQVPGAAQTTANVTVLGNLDNLIVTYFPVNFTVGDGVAPGTDNNPKQNNPFLNVTTGVNTNVNYNISINATIMSDGIHSIPVNEIKVNYTCCDGGCTDYPTLIELSNSLQSLCQNLQPRGYARIYFYLDVPAGQYNNTYNGDIWIYAYSALAASGLNNQTWYGPNNTTATVKKRIGIVWTLSPIDFAAVSPGSPANATLNTGWPTNITVAAATNVYVDMYINGTDLSCLSGACLGPPLTIIESWNITYANSTHNNYNSTGPQPPGSEYWHVLNNTRPATSTRGDFANWGMIPNRTDVYSYWNISVPVVPGGRYGGDVVATAVDAGTSPV